MRKKEVGPSDEGVLHGAYLPPEGQIENQKYYEGIITFNEIQVKLTHTGEPLIGAEKVVEWLVHSKSVYALPEKQDNMCFWRFLAAFFKVTDLKRLEKAAKDLAKRCLGPTRLSKKVSMETISEAAQTMDITITVYHPTWQNGAVVCELRVKFGTGDQIMHIGIVEGHCYLIKDLEGLCKIWRCTKCGAAFNRASNLKRHKTEVDCSPEPKVICEGKRVEGILSASDKVFCGTRSGTSLKAAQWIACQENTLEATMKKVGEQKTQFYEVCSEHVPISVAILDSVTNEPVYLVDPDPKNLVAHFLQVLLEKREAILERVTKIFPRPCDFDHLSSKERWVKWEQQVPVFGFNSSSYDLRLIMRYLAEDLCNLGGVKMAEKDGSYFFILTQQFKFLDVCKFLAPGTSYAKWIGSHGWKDAKLVFPYEWLDDFRKLSQGPPPIEAFTTRMKGPLDKEHYERFISKYQEEGCDNMGDWLRVYNSADVVPFVDCLQKEINKYVPFGIDICKDAVSIPGVSLRYLINQSEKVLYAPTDPVYKLLKKGMIGGPL